MARVLVVDDDDIICELFKIDLESEGFEVMICTDGNSVKDAVKNFNPDLIFLDIFLPGKNGIEVINELSSNEIMKNISIIAMTSYKLDLVTKKKILESSSVVDFIEKPVDPRLIVTLTHSHLKS